MPNYSQQKKLMHEELKMNNISGRYASKCDTTELWTNVEYLWGARDKMRNRLIALKNIFFSMPNLWQKNHWMTRHANGPNFDRHHHHCRNYPDAGECNDTEVDSELTFSRNFTKSGQLADQLPNRGQQLPLTRDARPGPRRVRPRSLRTWEIASVAAESAEKLPEMWQLLG